MEDNKLSIKNIIKEVLAILFIVIILISFFAPTITIWGGLYYDVVKSEMSAIIFKTNLARAQYEIDGNVIWDCEDEEVAYDK